MSEDIIKRRLILDLAINDLIKVMNIIDGENKHHSNNKISTFTEIQYLDYETQLINEVKTRLENIFKD